MATTENEEVLTAEQRNLEYWNDMALKGTIYHQPGYKPSTPSQNQTGGTNHGSNGLRDEFTLSTYVHSTPGMKQSAADAIGNTIRNAI